jgi:hypothetical protein
MGEAQHKQHYCRWMELKLLATARKSNLNTARIQGNSTLPRRDPGATVADSKDLGKSVIEIVFRIRAILVTVIKGVLGYLNAQNFDHKWKYCFRWG